MIKHRLCSAILLLVATAPAVFANEVAIEFVTLERQDDNWRISVTLRHGDSGWDHYADEWRVLDGQGSILGRRILHHPHVDEQPFTRSQSEITIPSSLGTVVVEAHDTVHGWSKDRIVIEMRRSQGERYRITEP